MGIFSAFKITKDVTPEERRAKNNSFIKSSGIACFENLPMIEDEIKEKFKDIDTICKRAITSLLIIQLAFDANTGNYEEGREGIIKWLDKFDVKECLIPKEKALLDGEYTKQDAIDISWTYEAYWSLVWALGLVNDIKKPYDICDCRTAINLVASCESFNEFKNKCKIRDINEIVNMLDLYYRYHWACVEKQVNPNTNIGLLNPGVVVERRRGLEWLFSEEDDWNKISLDT